MTKLVQSVVRVEIDQSIVDRHVSDMTVLRQSSVDTSTAHPSFTALVLITLLSIITLRL